MGIRFEHHEVSELAGGDRSLHPLLVRRIRAVDRGDLQRFVDRDLLVGSPLAAAIVAARHHALDRHQRLEGAWTVVGRAWHRDAGVEKRSMREHPAHLVVAVLRPLLSVIVDVGPEGRRHGSGRLDARQQ